MTHEEREQKFKSYFEEILNISRSKGVEYANSDDANQNFKNIGKELGLDPKQILWVYATKHHQAIAHYLKTNTVHSEPIEGRINDLILYLLILRTML